MSTVTISGARSVGGQVTVLGDKSISHRALMVGAVARGRSLVGNLSPAEDVMSTARCLGACGVEIDRRADGCLAIEGRGRRGGLSEPAVTLDCANSGTTMRLLAGLLAGHPIRATLDGDLSLRRRPMERVAAPLRRMGAVVETAPGGCAPLWVDGRSTLRGGEHVLTVASAQVKSAILLAGLRAEGPVAVREPAPSRDHTERLLRACGIDIRCDGGRITLSPGEPEPFGASVPGDLSSAAFFLCLAASRPTWEIRCPAVGTNPGRSGVLEVLSAMGAEVVATPRPVDAGGEPCADVVVQGRELRGVRIGGSTLVRAIDEVPVLAVVATQAEGRTVIADAKELRHKESDRIARLTVGLRAFGANVEETPDGMIIDGPTPLRPARVGSDGDHRLAMAWAVAGSLTAPNAGSTTVDEADVVAVSYPSFFADLARVAR